MACDKLREQGGGGLVSTTLAVTQAIKPWRQAQRDIFHPLAVAPDKAEAGFGTVQADIVRPHIKHVRPRQAQGVPLPHIVVPKGDATGVEVDGLTAEDVTRMTGTEPATVRGEGETEQHLVEAVFIVELEDEGTHPRHPSEEGGVNEREEEAGDAARKEQGHRGGQGRAENIQ